MKKISLNAYAKLNLSLDITGKRSDGYHIVKMVMTSVGLHDTLDIVRKDSEGILTGHDLQIETECNDKRLATDKTNLCNKAAKLMAERFELTGTINITLVKNIPMAAGLAGGSADAAAVLRGINILYGLGLSAEDLRSLALPLGADVPYCITGGTVVAEGIGEKLTVLKPLKPCHIVIVKPDTDVSTKHIYEMFDRNMDAEKKHPDTEGLIRAIEDSDLQKTALKCFNVFESITSDEHSIITQITALMKRYGALNSIMSGSGPSVYGIFDDKAGADDCILYFDKHRDRFGDACFLTQPEKGWNIEDAENE